MNTTVLENKIDALTQVMKSLADDSRHFRELIDAELKRQKERSEKRAALDNMHEKHEAARAFVAHKGDRFEVIGAFNLPTKNVDPDKRASGDAVNVGEILEVTNVDVLSNKYETTITLFRIDCGVDCKLDLDQLRKLLENDLIVVINK